MKTPVPSRRAIVVFAWLLAAAVLLALVWLSARVTTLTQESHDADERSAQSAADRADLRHLLEQQAAALDDANAKLVELGQAPVEQPEIPPAPSSPLQGPPGPQGPVGPGGPRGPSCVEELGYPKCRGDQGAAGTAGTQGQQGDQGPAGKDGVDGKDGAQGPQGEPGPAGPPGPAGTALPGTYSCPAGEVLTGFTVAGDGSVSLACQPTIPAAQGGKQ